MPIFVSQTDNLSDTQKRNASKLYDEDDLIDLEIERLCSKKARFSLAGIHLTDVKVERVESATSKSVLSVSNSSRTISGDFFNHRPLAVAPKGYAGQFDGMVFRPDFIAGMSHLRLYLENTDIRQISNSAILTKALTSLVLR